MIDIMSVLVCISILMYSNKVMDFLYICPSWQNINDYNLVK